jgi:hypothetical protein
VAVNVELAKGGLSGRGCREYVERKDGAENFGGI